MIKSIRHTIVHGNRSVFHNKKFIFLLWIFNTISAIVLTVPIYNILIDNLGRSILSDKLAITFDSLWFLQFKNIYDVQIEQMPLSIYSVVVIYTIIQTFFLGGLIAVFNHPKKNHTVDLFFGGVKYFYRFFKVLLVSVVFYAAAFLSNDFLGNFITWLFKDSEQITALFILRSLRYLLLVFFIGVIALLSDYSKVSLAVRDKVKVLHEVSLVILFIKNNFNKIFSIFLIVAAFGAIGAIIYNIIGAYIPRTPYYYLMLSFILQQMLIIFRLFIRMLFCATEIILFKDLSAEVVSADAQ